MEVQDLKFKNNDLYEIVKYLDRRREYSEKNLRAAAFQQIILNLGTLYPDDKTMLYDFFFKEHKQTRRGGQGGDVTLHKIKSSSAQQQNGTPPCDGCEEEHMKVQKQGSSGRSVKTVRSKMTATTETTTEIIEKKKFASIKDCETVDDIILYFGETEEESLVAMKAHLNTIGVSIGTAKRAKTIAGKVLNSLEEGV